MKLKNIRTRINEIEQVIADKHTGILASSSILDEHEKNQLVAELRSLERKEQFLSNDRQVGVSRMLGICSILVGVFAIFASLYIPFQQREMDTRAQIETAYKNLVTNADIYISNSNGIRTLSSKGEFANIPELYVNDTVSDDARKEIQNAFGLIQYRFFLYYVQQTDLLNQEIRQIRNELITAKVANLSEAASTTKYLKTMEYLEMGGDKTKFNYLEDTECLQFFFEQSFPYLTIDGRGEILKCRDESLEARLFNHFGYLPAETPDWLKPLMRRALNTRGDGVGDRLIQTDSQ